MLGEGAFGPIYRGELVNTADGNGAQIIVKSLRDGTSPDLLQVSITGQISFDQQTDGQMSALIIKRTNVTINHQADGQIPVIINRQTGERQQLSVLISRRTTISFDEQTD